MDPLGVLIVVVLAFGAGTGFGLWLRREEVTASRRRRGPAASSAHTPRTIQAIDGLVADSIRRLATWVRPGGADASSGIELASDGTLTLLFSDIAGSTRINHQLGDDAFARLLRRHDELVRELVGAHDGHVVKTQGDGFLAVFRDAHDGVACALELQEVLGEPSHTGQSLALRIGLHTGGAVTGDGDVFGESVAFAARVAARAGGGDVLVSDEVRHRVASDVDDLVFSGRLLRSRLKGIPGRHRLHRVTRAA